MSTSATGTPSAPAWAAAMPAASPIGTMVGSTRMVPHPTWLAEQHPGTSRLSISRGSRQRYGTCPGRVSSVIRIFPSRLDPPTVSQWHSCESRAHSVTPMLSAWMGARSRPGASVLSCSVNR